MEDANPARRRKSNRVSIFGTKKDDDEEESPAKQKPTDQDASKKKTRGSRHHGRAGKGLGKPEMKKKKHTSIEFMPRDSELLESRIYEPSWISRTWRLLTDGIAEPEGNTAEESHIYHQRSFGMYILHVILAFWVIYGNFDLEYNYHSIVMSDLITRSYFESKFILKSIHFHQIHVPQSIWDFIRGVILKVLYPVETYNSTNSVLQDNVMVGVAQLRQVRVKENTCNTGPFFKDLYKSCYGHIREGNEAEDTEPFGLKSSTPWKYSINLEKTIRGKFDVFTGSGYAMNFSKDYNWTLDQLTELENNQWIRLGTRAVFLEFATFCPNVNTFLVVKITFEIMPWGAVFPTSNVYSIKLLTSLNDAKAFWLLGTGIVLLGYTIGLNYVLLKRLKRAGLKTFFNIDNLIDAALISSTYTTLGVHIALAHYTNQKLDSIVQMVHRSEHPTFGIFIKTYEMYLTSAAVFLLCIVLKFIRYLLHFNGTAKLMFCAISKVKGELICFTIMNLSILFAFSFGYCLVYGTVYENMTTPMRCLVMLIYNHARAYSISVDDEVNGMLDPTTNVLIFVCVPVAVIYINCISLPTYVALVVHGWQQAVRDCAKEPLRIKAFETSLARVVQILEKLKLFKWANKLQELYITRMNEDDYYLITEIMRRYGWTPLEIRLMLRKYGIRKGDDLTIEELFEVYQDFWMKNALFFEVSHHEQLKSDLEYIQRMIKYTESTIADLKLSVGRLADQYLDKQAKQRPILTDTSPESTTSPSRKSILSRMWKR